MAFQKIFHFNTSTNQQLENFLCVTESSHQKGFHLAQKGRFIVVQPIKTILPVLVYPLLKLRLLPHFSSLFKFKPTLTQIHS